MKILLIQPKMNKRPMDTNLKTCMAPSMALLTLLQLTPQQHETVMVNENVEKINYNLNADLIGITVTVDVMPRASMIAAEFRKRGIPVVAGGIHITCCPEECVSAFDALCVGMAERVWERILDDTERGCLQKIYQDTENFQGTEIASPAYGQINVGQYLYTNVLTTSRGCPNHCDFCYNSCGNRIYVTRPVADVIRDIETLNVKHVYFVDDNFIGTPSYTRKLLEALHDMNLKWNAAVTTQILDHLDLLDLMVQTGCQSLFVGFESINDESLIGVNKNNRFEKYERLVEAIHSRGIMINASMVFGLDGDTPEVFDKTLAWLVKNRIETLTSHILTPYPGTALHRRMKGTGRITNCDLSKYNTAHVVFEPKGMNQKELYDGYLQMYRKFYSFRNIIRRMPLSKAQRKPYLLFNLFYRKFGKLTSALARLIPMRTIGRMAERISYTKHC